MGPQVTIMNVESVHGGTTTKCLAFIGDNIFNVTLIGMTTILVEISSLWLDCRSIVGHFIYVLKIKWNLAYQIDLEAARRKLINIIVVCGSYWGKDIYGEKGANASIFHSNLYLYC